MILKHLVLVALLVTSAAGHGKMTAPTMRSSHGDYCAHCLNGGGRDRVRRIGGAWTPYEPMKTRRTGFGICGDSDKSNAHMKSGSFGRRSTAVTEYEAGGIANFAFKVTATHRGFMEFYLCDVENNPGQDIQFSTFARDCHYLERVPHTSCESGNDPDCGPIDPKYPGRWMFPCGGRTYGGENGKMAYRLPNKKINVGVIHAYWMVRRRHLAFRSL